MVVKLISFLVYKIYLLSRSFLLKHNNLVYKDDFDFVFWGDGL